MKKVLSLLLAVIMCFSISISAFAGSDTIERTCPKVFVNGFMASTVWVNPDDPDSETAWPPSQDAILKTVKNAIGPLAKVMLDGNWDNFAVSLSGIIDELFAPACSDYNGEVTNGSGIRFEYPKRKI